MTFPTAARRLALWKVAAGLGAAAAASLAFTAGANAAVVTVTPDNNAGTDNLTAAFNSLPTSAASNTLVLKAGRYTPNAPITVSASAPPLTITEDHSVQAGGATVANVTVSNESTQHPANPWLTISGGNVTFEGVQIQNGGTTQAPVIAQNGGTLTMWDSTIVGSSGVNLAVNTGTTTLNGVTFSGNANGDGVDVTNATLTANNIFIATAVANGLSVTGGTNTINNSIIAANGPNGTDCNFAAGTTVTLDHVSDDDGTCIGGTGDSTLVNYETANGFPQVLNNGGPTATYEFLASVAGTPTGMPEAGDTAKCPTTDQRFFVNPPGAGGRACSIGTVTGGRVGTAQGTETGNAVQQTTGPTCAITKNIAGPPKQQQVTVTDPGSGEGPEAGAATDNPSNTIATAYPPPAAVPVPDYAISNVQIDNGSVAFTPFTAPSNGGLVLTATKATAGQPTHWSFTATNWAGIPTNCF